MDRTNANDFRSNLKEWMEAARSEPVKITRKCGEAFVLINADVFEKMQLDLARLHGFTASLVDVAQGRVKPASAESAELRFERAKSKAVAMKKGKAKKVASDKVPKSCGSLLFEGVIGLASGACFF